MRLHPAALLVLLFGCTPAVVRDDSPKHSTAVVRTYFNNLGFKGLFTSESTHTVWTRPAMRRSEDEFKFTGFFMKRMAKAQDEATIWRVDRRLLWRLNLPEKFYTECPITGCVSRERPAQRPREEAPREQRAERKPSCPLSIAKNHFSVKSTGETKTINGFDARGYKVVWEIVVQDKKKRKDTSTVNIDVWTASDSDPRLAAVRGVESQFESALHAAHPPKQLDKAISPEAMKIIAMQFLSRMNADQRDALTSAGQELSKIHGHPIATKLEWYLEGDACAEAESASQAREERSSGSSLDLSHGLGGFIGSAGSAAAKKGVEKKMDDMKGKPVFGFEMEVKQMEVAPASDGLFVPPADFKKKS